MLDANDGFWAQIARTMVPVILVVVAVTQVALAHAVSLTPWKGGGFGMFATVDHLDTRFARIELQTMDGVRVPVAVDRYVAEHATGSTLERARAMPDTRTLSRLGGMVLDDTWVYEDDFAVPASSDRTDPESEVISVVSATVSIWGYRFDRAEAVLEPFLIAQRTTVTYDHAR